MTKKKIIIGSIVAAVFVAAGAMALYVYTNINKEAPVVVNQSPNVSADEAVETKENTVVFSSTFTGVDAVHWGRGGAQVLQTVNGPVLSFGDDFEVAQGPDLFVYLSPNAAGQELGEYASLGSLKSVTGAQEYTLPDNYESYKTVVIWCRAFGVTFATAELRS